uniref:hypothetical protein n=1 Tax=Jeotgalibaca porci TaxID=1868793 RepID=UPI0035A02703
IFYDKEILSSETGERLVYTKAEIEGNEGFVSKADYRVDADGWSAELSRVEGVALSSGANINLLVRKGELDGYYLGNDGLPSGSAVFAISARLIPVSVGESITFSKASSGFFHYGFRNSAGAFFGKVQNNANEFTITVPTGAVNLEVSYRKDTLPKVERGTIKTQWTLAPEDQVNQSNIVYLEGLVSQTAEALTSVYTKTEIDGQLGTKLPTAVHNTFAQQTADSFAQTAKLTELNSALGRLSEAEAGIASNALSINLKASQTEFSGLKSTVENMKIGGRNYYSNLSTKVSRLVGTARKIQKNTINGFDLKGDHTDLLNVRVENVIKSAGWWTVSFDVRVKSGANNSTFTFQVVDNSRVVTVTLTSQNWVRVEQAFDVTRHSDIFNFVDIDGLRYFEYEFRNFKVEKGNKATDWTPAPEDDAVLISKLESDLTIESGRINALSTKVNANESFIGQLTVSPDGIVGTVAEINNITQKIAKISVTEQLVNGLQTTVGDADTGLVSQVNQIAGGLQSVVTDFENISIGGTNLINGSKTFGPTFLAQRYNLTTLVTNTWDPFGKSSPILHTVNSSPDGVSKNYLRIMNVVKEKAPHTFSVWARRYQGIGSAVPVSISIGDDRDDNVIMIGATWEKHVVHYTPYRDVNTFNFLQIRHLQYDNFRIEWFNPKLEVGTIASDWSHSLDDLATMDYVGSEISQLQNNINFRVSKNDVINQINISTEGILLAGKKIHITGQTTIDTAVIKSAHIDTLNVSKLTGTVAEFVTLSSKVITADSITSIHIKSENALIDKLFATSALIDRLTSKTAFITSIKAIDISADRITAGTLNAANVNIINLNVSSLVGNKSNFVETAFNAINSNISINGDRLLVVHSNGSQTRIDANGLHHIEGGVSYRTHYLTEVGRISVNTSNLAITEGVLVTLPAIFKGKPFKVSVSISDVLSYEHPQYNNLAIQRIVSFPSQGSINHANGTFKIYGYARTINYKTDNVIHVPVQVQYTVTV